MNIEEIKNAAQKIIEKLQSEDGLLEKFKANPIETIKETLGFEATSGQLKEIFAVVETKLAEGSIKKEATEIFGKIKGLFNK
ncbi:MAG: hypothetical protein PHI27_12925 [Eubacteriales bacterium]|nr:hypothetical protein [Eubacteriales bacterium]MDD3883125.1 hypothetical protein [Eubacteriales bacterium]MDD4512705.1 hypothetical protein [Eubacteriales bacterium]